MGGTPKQTLYPFNAIFEVTTSGTDSVDIWQIPKGFVMTMVLAKMKTAGTGSGNLTIGDDDAGDGFILAADATAAADVVYGDAVTERGTYIYDATSKAGHVKVYTVATKELKLDCSAALTTEATIDVFVFGYTYSEID